VALLNYPDLVKMMSGDLQWTQQLGAAIATQQDDLLTAIQQLRDEAQAKGLLKSTDKVLVEESGDNIVIQSANPEVVYVPQYPPEMFYQPGYWPAEIYYESYPSYYYPTAPWWPGFFTGWAWGSFVDWADGGCWGGNIDVDIDIDHEGNWNLGDFANRPHVDPRTLDRGKFKGSTLDRAKVAQDLRGNNRNQVADRAKDRFAGGDRTPGGNLAGKDIRSSVTEGLKGHAAAAAGGALAGAGIAKR
jgi:hypothetical protein